MTGIDAIVRLNELYEELSDVELAMARERKARGEALGLGEDTWDTDRRSRHLSDWQGKVSAVKDRLNDVRECLRDIGSAELMSGCLQAIRRVEAAAGKYTDYAAWPIPAPASSTPTTPHMESPQ